MITVFHCRGPCKHRKFQLIEVCMHRCCDSGDPCTNMHVVSALQASLPFRTPLQSPAPCLLVLSAWRPSRRSLRGLVHCSSKPPWHLRAQMLQLLHLRAQQHLRAQWLWLHLRAQWHQSPRPAARAAAKAATPARALHQRAQRPAARAAARARSTTPAGARTRGRAWTSSSAATAAASAAAAADAAGGPRPPPRKQWPSRSRRRGPTALRARRGRA